MGLLIKDNVIEIKNDSGNTKFSTNRLLSSIVFRQSGTINITDYNYQAPIIIKEHPAIVSDPEKYFMFISYNIYGGDINSQAETVNGMGSVLLGVYKDIDGYFAGSIILDFVSGSGVLTAKITKHVKGGAKIDWSGSNYQDAPNITINYAVQYCRFANNLVPVSQPLERLTASCLLVGGGGGGGGGSVGMSAGGGGAGEFKEFNTILEAERTYRIYVGYGGKGGGDLLNTGNGVAGEHTLFYNYTALGGAGGANGSTGGYFIGQGGLHSFGSGSGGSGNDQYWVEKGLYYDPGTGFILRFLDSVFYKTGVTDEPTQAGPAGGSINKPIRDYYSTLPSTEIVPTIGPGRTHAGGSGRWYNGGGGGGAGSAGVNGQIPGNRSRNDSGNVGGIGGSGYASSITGTSITYAAGGSGGTVGIIRAASIDGIGGEGGSALTPQGGNAVANTGSGGGGKGFSEIINDILTARSTGSGTTLVGGNSAAASGAFGGFFVHLFNTSFNNELAVGDVILIDEQVKTIVSITNDYTATVNTPFNPAITSRTLVRNLTRSRGHTGGDGGSGIIILKIPTPYTAVFSEGVVSQHITSVSGYNIYKITETKTIYENVQIKK